jgi:hypothetical protein
MVWYFTEPGALILPAHTLYASRNYSTGIQGTNLVGEVFGAPRPWRNGSPPVVLAGDHFCGDLTNFESGTSFSLAHDEPLDVNGDPACCTGLPVVTGPMLPDPLPPGISADFGAGSTFFVLGGVHPNEVYNNDGDPPEVFLQLVQLPGRRIRFCPRWQLVDNFFGPHALDLVSFDNATFTSIWRANAFTFGFAIGTLFAVRPFP